MASSTDVYREFVVPQTNLNPTTLINLNDASSHVTGFDAFNESSFRSDPSSSNIQSYLSQQANNAYAGAVALSDANDFISAFQSQTDFNASQQLLRQVTYNANVNTYSSPIFSPSVPSKSGLLSPTSANNTPNVVAIGKNSPATPVGAPAVYRPSVRITPLPNDIHKPLPPPTPAPTTTTPTPSTPALSGQKRKPSDIASSLTRDTLGVVLPSTIAARVGYGALTNAGASDALGARALQFIGSKLDPALNNVRNVYQKLNPVEEAGGELGEVGEGDALLGDALVDGGVESAVDAGLVEGAADVGVVGGLETGGEILGGALADAGVAELAGAGLAEAGIGLGAIGTAAAGGLVIAGVAGVLAGGYLIYEDITGTDPLNLSEGINSAKSWFDSWF